jgi:hypothetical protein
MTNPAPTGGDERNVEPPPAPAQDSTELLEPTPAYDSLAQEAALTEPVLPPAAEPARPPAPLVESEYDTAVDYGGTPSGPLAQVKAFAAERPAVFLGVALAAGWLVGKLLSSSDDD